MTPLVARDNLSTHRVENQPLSRGDLDLWSDDIPLREAILREYGQPLPLAAYGAALGQAELRQAGRDANRSLPELHLFDAGGRRLDEVRFHPAYHRLMQAGLEAGYSAIAWEEVPGGHVTHAAMVYQAS